MMNYLELPKVKLKKKPPTHLLAAALNEPLQTINHERLN